VIPADDKHNARLLISQIVLETLESLKLKPLVATKERVRELKEIRKVLGKK